MDLEAEVISEAQERCTRPFAPTAKKNVKYPSSPPRAGRFIARTVFQSTGSPGTEIDKSHHIVLSIFFKLVWFRA